MKKFSFLLIVTFTFFFSRAQNNFNLPVQATIENGIIEGNFNTADNLQEYFGVPYAKPPVGNLRWRAPEPPANWSGVLQTKAFGPRAVQSFVFNDMKFRSNGLNEDCLYLNIWSPAVPGMKNLPVLVYFYGGGLVAGDGSEFRYDGASMAKKGIVVVTVNYRLNIFGFLALPELSAESPYKASGNYGLLDQVAALQWVQKNIAAFGGDPSRVTIAGESAGSISVSLQMASPLSKNLFSAAIGESGAAITPTMPPVSLAEAEKEGLAFLKTCGSPSLAQLRAMSTLQIYELYNQSKKFGFPTVIDGYFLKKSVPEIFKVGEQTMVPLLAGWNSAEIPGIAFMQGLPYTEENYIKRIKDVYPGNFEEVLKLYPHGTVNEIEQSATALASDRFIVYSTWKWIDLQSKNSNQPVYRYLFSKIRPQDPDPHAFRLIGAPHASEIEYCLGNLYLVKEHDWTEDDYKVSKIMQNYFANFIKNHNPNGNDLPDWPAVEKNEGSPGFMNINTTSKAEKAANDARYIFLNKVYGN